MNAMRWLERSNAMDAMNSHIASTSNGLAKHFDKARHALVDGGSHGVDVARDLGGELLVGTRRLGRSTQGMIVERPLQAVLIVGAAAFTLGWIARRARELRAARVASRASARKQTRARNGKTAE